jgi:hypothetical protein
LDATKLMAGPVEVVPAPGKPAPQSTPGASPFETKVTAYSPGSKVNRTQTVRLDPWTVTAVVGKLEPYPSELAEQL